MNCTFQWINIERYKVEGHVRVTENTAFGNICQKLVDSVFGG